MCQEAVAWVFKWSDAPDLLLATCGIWEVDFAIGQRRAGLEPTPNLE